MDGFLKDWSIVNTPSFALSVLCLAVIVRTIFACLAAFKVATEGGGLTLKSWCYWAWRVWCGFGQKTSNFVPNYWYTAVIGAAELAAYPVLIATGSFTAIGAWIGLKTIAQWKVWQTDRGTFNLFLIGNILVLAGAYWLTRFVAVA